jgi:hypothetical protein
MRASRAAHIEHHASAAIYVVAASGTVLVATFLKVDPASWATRWPLFSRLATTVQNAGPIILIAGTAAAGSAKAVRGMVGRPRSWDLVHETLDQMRRLAFDKVAANDPLHHHRVTLFKAVGIRWCPILPWPTRRWLVPYERSGHTTRENVASFKIPDAADGVEGIAGQTWTMDGVLVVADLPELVNGQSGDSVNEYAKRTFVDPAFIRRKLERGDSLARSFCGIPVQVRGAHWGVLVFDSRQPNAIGALAVFKSYAQILGGLLERGA